MGVLDNTTITVDAILTKKGRELLAQGEGKFKITKFALADDEIDYGLYDITHPNGSNFYGAAIENMNLLEAIPNQTLAVKYFLGNTNVSVGTAPVLSITGAGTINFSQTGQYTGNTTNFATELYDWVISSTQYASIVTAGGQTAKQSQASFTKEGDEFGQGGGYTTGGTGGGTSTSSVRGTSVTIRAKELGVLGSQNRQVVLTGVGVTSGATATKTITLAVTG
jgi:hypothetical protein